MFCVDVPIEINLHNTVEEHFGSFLVQNSITQGVRLGRSIL